MKVLVLNSGSSSIKYQLLDMQGPTRLAAGEVERIGEAESAFKHQQLDADDVMQTRNGQRAISDHQEGFRLITDLLGKQTHLDAIGHRVVHAGEAFAEPVRVNADLIGKLRAVCDLAPLHNPANLAGIEICFELFSDIPQVAVFDTAFHQSMPPYAYRYPLPESVYKKYAVRRYGFHGTSHGYVAKQAAGHLQTPLSSLNLITLHLGNGASAAAISGGRCIDTSMGLTPMEGLMMGTRCGDIDPAITFYLQRNSGLDMDEIESLYNHESGLKGICGENDMREVLRLADENDESAQLAIDMYCYRIKKYIGAFYAALGRVDALVFTAGIGEHAPPVRKQSCAGLDALGIIIDEHKNQSCENSICEIQAGNSAVKVLVIGTDEEMEIARQTLTCIKH